MNFNTYECYTDESGTSKPHKYMVIGGLIAEKSTAQDFDSLIEDFKTKNNISFELKWKKVGSNNLDQFIQYIDFLKSNQEYIHYKSVVIDRTKLNHKKYNHKDQTLGYYKIHYQLMVNCFGKYFEDNDKCMLFIDKAEVSYDLNNYKNILNNGIKKKFPNIKSDIFRTVEWKDSRKSNLIQAADILTGGLRLKLNLEIIDGKPDIITEEKKYLANYICKTWNINPYKNTPMIQQNFSIWHFILRD